MFRLKRHAFIDKCAYFGVSKTKFNKTYSILKYCSLEQF